MASCANQAPALVGAATHSLDVKGMHTPQGTLYLHAVTRASPRIKTKWLKSFKISNDSIETFEGGCKTVTPLLLVENRSTASPLD
jgi:hypothetical protein